MSSCQDFPIRLAAIRIAELDQQEFKAELSESGKVPISAGFKAWRPLCPGRGFIDEGTQIDCHRNAGSEPAIPVLGPTTVSRNPMHGPDYLPLARPGHLAAWIVWEHQVP